MYDDEAFDWRAERKIVDWEIKKMENKSMP